jgi:hypothetical protein
MSNLRFPFDFENGVRLSLPFKLVALAQGIEFAFRHVSTLALKDSAMSRAVVPRTPHEVAGEQEFRAVDWILASQFEAEPAETLR